MRQKLLRFGNCLARFVFNALHIGCRRPGKLMDQLNGGGGRIDKKGNGVPKIDELADWLVPSGFAICRSITDQ
jgi:hypothetical protein